MQALGYVVVCSCLLPRTLPRQQDVAYVVYREIFTVKYYCSLPQGRKFNAQNHFTAIPCLKIFAGGPECKKIQHSEHFSCKNFSTKTFPLEYSIFHSTQHNLFEEDCAEYQQLQQLMSSRNPIPSRNGSANAGDHPMNSTITEEQ